MDGKDALLQAIAAEAERLERLRRDAEAEQIRAALMGNQDALSNPAVIQALAAEAAKIQAAQIPPPAPTPAPPAPPESTLSDYVMDAIFEPGAPPLMSNPTGQPPLKMPAYIEEYTGAQSAANKLFERSLAVNDNDPQLTGNRDPVALERAHQEVLRTVPKPVSIPKDEPLVDKFWRVYGRQSWPAVDERGLPVAVDPNAEPLPTYTGPETAVRGVVSTAKAVLQGVADSMEDARLRREQERDAANLPADVPMEELFSIGNMLKSLVPGTSLEEAWWPSMKQRNMILEEAGVSTGPLALSPPIGFGNKAIASDPVGGPRPVGWEELADAFGSELPVDPRTGMQTEPEAMQILRWFQTVPAVLTEVVERVPVMPKGHQAPIVPGQSIFLGTQPFAKLDSKAPPGVEAATAIGLQSVGAAADKFWTVSDSFYTVGELAGIPAGDMQTTHAGWGADALHGILERVENGSGLEEDASLVFRNRFGPEYENTGYWLGLIADVAFPAEGMAMGTAAAAARGAKMRTLLREVGVTGDIGRHITEAMVDPTVDVTELIRETAMRTFEEKGIEGMPPELVARMRSVAMTEYGEALEDMLADAGYAAPESATARADLDDIAAARAAAFAPQARRVVQAPEGGVRSEVFKRTPALDPSVTARLEAQGAADAAMAARLAPEAEAAAAAKADLADVADVRESQAREAARDAEVATGEADLLARSTREAVEVDELAEAGDAALAPAREAAGAAAEQAASAERSAATARDRAKDAVDNVADAMDREVFRQETADAAAARVEQVEGRKAEAEAELQRLREEGGGEESGFAPRPGSRAAVRRPKAPPRPRHPEWAEKPTNEREFWVKVAESEAARDVTVAPKGYDLNRHMGFERIANTSDEVLDDADYVVRDAAGRNIRENLDFFDAAELVMKRQRDGDSVRRQSSNREAMRWNRVQQRRASVELVADYHMASPAETAYVDSLRRQRPEARPGRLKAARQAGLISPSATAEQVEAAARRAVELAAEADDARVVLLAAGQDLAAARRGSTRAAAALADAKKVAEQAAKELEQSLAQAARANAELAAKEAALGSLPQKGGAKRSRARAEADLSAAKQRAAEAARRHEAASALAQEARDRATEAAKLDRTIRRKLRDAEQRAATAKQEAATRRAKADSAAATVAKRDLIKTAAQRRIGRERLNRLVGAPTERVPFASNRVEDVIRDASRLMGRDRAVGGATKLLPDLTLVTPRVYNRIMETVDLMMGTKNLDGIRAYARAREWFAKLAPELANGRTPLNAATHLWPGSWERRTTELAVAAGLTPEQMLNLTPMDYNHIRRQAIREAGGVYADWRYTTREAGGFVDRMLAGLRRPPGQTRLSVAEVGRRMMAGPLSMFVTQPAEGLGKLQRMIWNRMVRQVEVSPGEAIEAFRRASGTPAEIMAELVGEWSPVMPKALPLAGRVDVILRETELHRMGEKQTKALMEARDALKAMWRPNEPRPKWLDSPSPQVVGYGMREWSRTTIIEASVLGREWVEMVIEAMGTRVEEPIRSRLNQAVDVPTALRIYEEVYGGKNVAVEGSALAEVLPNIVRKTPNISHLNEAMFFTLLREKARNTVRNAIDQMLKTGAAVPFSPSQVARVDKTVPPMTRDGRVRAPEAALGRRLTQSDVITSVLENTHTVVVDGVVQYRYPLIMVDTALEILERWGIQPGAGAGATRKVQAGGRMVLVPASLADKIEAMAMSEAPQKAAVAGVDVKMKYGPRIRLSPYSANPVAQVLRGSTRAWSMAVTAGLAPIPGLMNPQFFTSNIIGAGPLMIQSRGAPQALLDQSRIGRHPRLVSWLMRRQAGVDLGDSGLAPVLSTATGEVVTLDMLYEAAVKERLFDTTIGHVIDQDLRELFNERVPSESAFDFWFRKAKWAPKTSTRILRAMSSGIETTFRLGTYLEEARKGVPLPQAAQTAADALPNYHRMTAFEKATVKTLLPFYAFARKSSDSYYYALMKHPERVGMMARTSLKNLNLAFENEIEKGGLTDDNIARMTVWQDRNLFDRDGNLNPLYAMFNLQSGIVGISDFFMMQKMLLSPIAVLTPGSDENRRAIGMLNPWFQMGAIALRGEKLTGPFSRRDLIVPDWMLSQPEPMASATRRFFAVGPSEIEESRGEDPRMASPSATALMGNRGAWVWRAGAASGLDGPTTVDELEAGQRLYMMLRVFLGRNIDTVSRTLVLAGAEPAPPELSWGQLVVAEALGLRWVPTYSEYETMRRHWNQKGAEIEERTNKLEGE